MAHVPSSTANAPTSNCWNESSPGLLTLRVQSHRLAHPIDEANGISEKRRGRRGKRKKE
ncbi:hypothetical protein CCACVL1_18621 [Corchorus capsularis]|uniref:Uncharacterized protein n=1 Tax=Corchorus capsularis TaxID=210143 RepID=A0A1R3HKM5_COCAP|nr:hypothetical protein CCACVL1_18621 [Corchorus capsularis]